MIHRPEQNSTYSLLHTSAFDYLRQMHNKMVELDMAVKELMIRDSRINKLENEVGIYQANYKLLSDQLQETQQMNQSLRQRVSTFLCVKLNKYSLFFSLS